MAGLLGLLDLGAGALLAQQAGVAVSGRNAANVNTEGYSRERIDLQSELAAPLVGGVRAGDSSRAADNLLAGQERSASGSGGASGALANALGGLELDLTNGDGVGQSIAQFFASVSQVAAAPLDSARRADVVTKAQAVASDFQQASLAITNAQNDADSRISTDAQQATTLAAQIAAANHALSTSHDPVLADQRDLAAKQLAALVGGAARIDPDGKMRFVLAGGAVLVDGDRAATLSAVPDATLGNHVRIDVVDGTHKVTVTNALDGGAIAGEIQFRDGTAATAATRLDQLAFDFASQVNAVHRANAGLDGVSGRDLFVQPAAVGGAALAMAVSSSVAADPSQVAAASPAAGSGDVSGVAALLALRDSKSAAGGTATFSDEGIGMIGDLGAATRSATDAKTVDDQRTEALAAARDSLSGVSSDEETANLAKYQRAAEAATRFVATVDDLLSKLIENI